MPLKALTEISGVPFLEELMSCEANVGFKWVKAHGTGLHLWSGRLTVFEHRGNCIADAFADAAAARACLDDAVIIPYDMTIGRSVLIQNRLMSVMKLVSEHDKLIQSTNPVCHRRHPVVAARTSRPN